MNMKNEPYDLDALRAAWQPCCRRVDSLLQASDGADYRLPSRRDLRRPQALSYTVALMLLGVGSAALMPAPRYDYVLGTHASHPEVAYRNTQTMLQNL